MLLPFQTVPDPYIFAVQGKIQDLFPVFFDEIFSDQNAHQEYPAISGEDPGNSDIPDSITGSYREFLQYTGRSPVQQKYR